MPLHADVRTLLDLLDAMGGAPIETQDVETARAERAALAPPPMHEGADIRDLDAGGVPARLYHPAGDGGPLGLLVWFHGGGFVIGDLDSHDNVCRSLAVRAGHAVLSVAYRLAPEHPFPAGLDDCVEATRWAHANAAELGVDPARIAVGGDSAGANLATVVCHLAPAPLVFQLLVYPVVDATCSMPSYVENADGYFLTATGMKWFIDHYLSGGSGSAEDPRVSPLFASDDALSKSPPAMVLTAGYDPLRDEGVAYADRLGAAGVVTSHVHFPGQVHAFFSLPHMLADARAAHALAAVALAGALAPTAG